MTLRIQLQNGEKVGDLTEKGLDHWFWYVLIACNVALVIALTAYSCHVWDQTRQIMQGQSFDCPDLDSAFKTVFMICAVFNLSYLCCIAQEAFYIKQQSIRNYEWFRVLPWILTNWLPIVAVLLLHASNWSTKRSRNPTDGRYTRLEGEACHSSTLEQEFSNLEHEMERTLSCSSGHPENS